MRWDAMSSPQLAEAAAGGAIVVVPVGSVEQHGPHLPVATDAWAAEHLVEAALPKLPSGRRVVIAPVVRYGFSDDHAGFPGTLSIPARLLEELLIEIGAGIIASGFDRILLVNGHGGNDRLLYYVVRLIRDRAPRPVALAGLTYWKLAAEQLRSLRHSEPGGMGHACELETSLMLHFRPETVRMRHAVREVPVPYSGERGGDLLSSGAVVAPDRFHELTVSGVTGDPLVASAEQGRLFAGAISGRLAAFIDEFASWPLRQGGRA